MADYILQALGQRITLDQDGWHCNEAIRPVVEAAALSFTNPDTPDHAAGLLLHVAKLLGGKIVTIPPAGDIQ